MFKIIATVVFCLTICGCSEQPQTTAPKKTIGKYISINDQKIDLEHAKGYRVIDFGKTNFPDRNRSTIHIIAPLADNHRAIAQTAIKAAIDLQKEQHTEIATVFLAADEQLVGKGYNLAIVNYAIDGLGITEYRNDEYWDVNAAFSPLTEQELAIAILWEKNRDIYYDPTDHQNKKLKRFIAKQLAIETGEVKKPSPGLHSIKYDPINTKPTSLETSSEHIIKIERQELKYKKKITKLTTIYIANNKTKALDKIRSAAADIWKISMQAAERWSDEVDMFRFVVTYPSEKPNSYDEAFSIYETTIGLKEINWNHPRPILFLETASIKNQSPQAKKDIAEWCKFRTKRHNDIPLCKDI